MEVKDKILQGAHELFFSRGLKNVTMEDVSKHLHISKKTIYKYFRDKESMVEDFIKTTLKKNNEELEHIAQISKDPVEEILLIMKYIASMFSRLNPNLIYDLQKHYPSGWKTFIEFKDKHMVQMVENNLRKGVEEGLYRNDIDVKVMARFRLATVELVMSPLIFPPDKFNMGLTQVALLKHFLYGITTLKGHKLINKYNEVEEEE